MLEHGERVPDVRVWVEPGEEPVPLLNALGARRTLLAFYLFDWSPG